MPPILQSKKKSELQDIAKALGLTIDGTKDDLCNKIRDHLDNHQDDLEEDPKFSSLYSKRRRASAKPPSTAKFEDTKPSPIRVQNRVIPFSPVYESTPTKDLRDVSAFLKTNVDHTPAVVRQLTPTRIPLPETPERSIIDRFRASELAHTIEQVPQKYLPRLSDGRQSLLDLRENLSRAKSIWSLTATGELLYILWSIPRYEPIGVVPLSNYSSHLSDIPLAYPLLNASQSPSLWPVLLHWAIPTLIAPILFGLLVSFHPITRTGDASALIAPLDYLTASIIRLAAQIIYPYTTIQFDRGMLRLDVLGFNWRILAASVGVAFAFAEAISLAPEAVARSYIAQHQQEQQELILAGLEEDELDPE